MTRVQCVEYRRKDAVGERVLEQKGERSCV